MLCIGIDPGTETGYAAWHIDDQIFTAVCSMPIHQAMIMVRDHHLAGNLKMVVFEDARQRSWFGAKGRESLQGAGSIKRDSAIWDEFLGDLGVPYKAVKPSAGATKWDAARFAGMTGWHGRTNEHARDAALLVWGMR